MSESPRRVFIAIVGLLAALTNGCGKSPTAVSAGSQPSTAVPNSGPERPLSEAERRYGISPTFNKDVKYQPDVIVMEHGSEAIRANSSNGLTWTIDANAPHASEIQKDKILFATGRAVGRVLAVERKGDNLDVTLGPAELTDIFEELHISTHQALDPAKMIAYYAPDYPGTFNDLDAPEEPAARIVRPSEGRNFASLSATTDIRRIRWEGRDALRSAVFADVDRHQFRAFKTSIPTAAQFGALTDISSNDYHFSPNCCGGMGVVIQYDKNGIKFVASAIVTLKHPAIDLTIDILHGLKNAYVEISGVGGLKLSIDGGNSGDIKNLNATIQLPMDFSLPIPSIGAPFSIVFRQAIRVTTVFTGKGASINATGEYEYGGTIRAGIRNGQLIAEGPTMGKTVQDLVDSLHSHSMGVNAIILGYGAKILVGIGAFDFVVGPYVGVDSTVGTTTGSDAQVGIGFVCRSADVNLWMDVGVGYALPGIVVKALNAFLSLFHAKEIPSTYTKALKSVAIYEGSKAIPPSCGKT